MKHVISYKVHIWFLVGLSFICCNPAHDVSGDFNGTYDVAFPLINTAISVNKVQSESSSNTALRIDEDGKVAVLYKGKVIRRSAPSIFPPLPFIAPIPILDTIYDSKIEFTSNFYIIENGTFERTKIFFNFAHSTQQAVKIQLSIIGLQKDGQDFSQSFDIPANQQGTMSYTSVPVSIDGWKLSTNNNSFRFKYSAILADGTSVVLDKAEMLYDFIIFSYLDGYLGYHKFGVDSSIINIGLFNQWTSGGFDFFDPKVSISIENAFGLPVRSSVNKLQLKTLSGNVFELESPLIGQGIDFLYPNFGEIGQVKITDFEFNKSNSNIGQIFNEKTIAIDYDIEALINPERDTTSRGFIDNSSFFSVDVAVEVPLIGSLNQVILQDTISLNLGQIDEEIEEGHLKFVLINDYPVDIGVQITFLDNNNQPLLQLFDDDLLIIGASIIDGSGKTIASNKKEHIETFTKVDIENILKNSKKAIIKTYFNSIDGDTKRPLWIYDYYKLDVKIGARCILNF